MTGQQKTVAHATTPTLVRETTAFLMKATYQRHMLFGMIVAVSLVLFPALLVAYWPVAYAEPIVGPEKEHGSIFILPPGYEIERPKVEPQGGGGGSRPETGGHGVFVDEVNIILDTSALEHEFEFDPGNGHPGPEGDSVVGDFGMPGWGGVTYVQDTGVYEFFSAELERTPALIAMEEPEYPPLARRAGIEGKVLLHVLVDIHGQAEEVRIHMESNPGHGFGDYAAEPARRATFSPGIANHQPVRCWVAIPVEFVLE